MCQKTCQRKDTYQLQAASCFPDSFSQSYLMSFVSLKRQFPEKEKEKETEPNN